MRRVDGRTVDRPALYSAGGINHIRALAQAND